MSDLISRSAFIAELEKDKESYKDDAVMTKVFDVMIELVQRQPSVSEETHKCYG